MKVAVTGASGFVGRYVVVELERRSVPVTIVLRPGTSPLAELKHHPVVYIDLANPPPNAFELMGKPDVLVHLAWEGLPNYKSLHHVEEGLPAQYRFLSMVVKSGLKNLFVAGTCFEYGMQYGPLHEGMKTQPDNPYAIAKDTLRKQLEYLKNDWPFSLTWGRLFYLYGEGQAKNSLFSQLLQAVKRGEHVFNMSGGEQLRDYLPITEAAGIIVSLAANNAGYGTVNVCSGKAISVRKLVEEWLRKNDWPMQLNLGCHPYPDYEPMAFWGDRQKLDCCLEKKSP